MFIVMGQFLSFKRRRLFVSSRLKFERQKDYDFFTKRDIKSQFKVFFMLYRQVKCFCLKLSIVITTFSTFRIIFSMHHFLYLLLSNSKLQKKKNSKLQTPYLIIFVLYFGLLKIFNTLSYHFFFYNFVLYTFCDYILTIYTIKTWFYFKNLGLCPFFPIYI